MKERIIIIGCTEILMFAGLIFGLYFIHNNIWALILQASGATIGIVLGMGIVIISQNKKYRKKNLT